MHVWWSFDVRVVSRGDQDYIISKIYGCRLKLKIVTIQWCVDHQISHDFLMMVTDNPHVMLSDSIWMWWWRSGSSNKVFWACLQPTDRPTVELRRLTMVYCRQHQPPNPRAGLIWKVKKTDLYQTFVILWWMPILMRHLNRLLRVR